MKCMYKQGLVLNKSQGLSYGKKKQKTKIEQTLSQSHVSSEECTFSQ